MSTQTQEHVQIEYRPLADFIPTPDNPRVFLPKDEDDPYLVMLAESIKTAGILEPLLGRPHPDKPGKIDLRAGECRHRAAKLAGLKTAPVIIRVMTDTEAILVTVTENRNRKDLTPIEEARVFQAMERRGYTREQIANDLKIPVRTVVRRLALASIDAAWVAAVADKRTAVSHWGSTHLELIARLPPTVQAALADDYLHRDGWRENQVKLMTPRELEQELANLTHLLSGAPWKENDASLVPQAGACADCPKRSDREMLLFEDEDAGDKKKKPGARCLDAECWQRKLAASIARKEAELAEKHQKPVVRISEDTYRAKQAGYDDAISTHSVRNCKKDDKAAVPAVYIDGPKAGQMAWIAKPSSSESGSGGRTGHKKTMEEKRLAYDKKRARHIIKVMVDSLKYLQDQSFQTASTEAWKLAVVASFGTDFRHSRHGLIYQIFSQNGEPERNNVDPFADVLENEKLDQQTLIEQLFGSTLNTLKHRLWSLESDIRVNNWVNLDECRKICNLLGWEFEEDFETPASLAYPYPSAWAKEEGATPAKAGKKAPRKAKAKTVETAQAAPESQSETSPAMHYLDTKGRILGVSSGISNGAVWLTVYRTPGKSGKHRVVSSALSERKDRNLAQADLDKYAVKKKLPKCCRVCGCTKDRACAGGCAWNSADVTICTACAEIKE